MYIYMNIANDSFSLHYRLYTICTIYIYIYCTYCISTVYIIDWKTKLLTTRFLDMAKVGGPHYLLSLLYIS